MQMNVSNVLDRTWLADTDERPAKREALTTAELAECTCPDFCERDHDTD
jgi:hypothetical protein